MSSRQFYDAGWQSKGFKVGGTYINQNPSRG
jgi:hypothetical protein